MKHEYNDITCIYTFDDLEDLFNFVRKNKNKIRAFTVEHFTATFKCYSLLEE